MPIDPSIPLSVRSPQFDNPLDVMSKAMTMKQLAMQNQAAERDRSDSQSLRDAYQKNVVTNPDGSSSLNRKAVLSDLYKANPAKAMEAERSFTQMEQEDKNRQLETLTKQVGIAKQLAWSISDEPSYQAARQKGIELGLPNANSLPPQFDPSFVKRMQMNTLTAEEQIAQQWKQKQYEQEERKIQSSALDRRDRREERRYEHGVKMDEKRLIRDEKKAAKLNEVEDRRRNIEDNLTLLEEMIGEDGTYEVLGSHNADLDRRVEAIATDMAKLADPDSVARPSEVEAFKKGLIQSNMASTSNATALNILKNFRSEVGSRVDNAYKIRGMQNPGSQAQRQGSAPMSYATEEAEKASQARQARIAELEGKQNRSVVGK